MTKVSEIAVVLAVSLAACGIVSAQTRQTEPSAPRNVNPTTGQTVPSPQASPPPDNRSPSDARSRDTGGTSGPTGQTVPNTGTPKITDEPSTRR
ncbi:hypothetical protein [Variibacter gotjawalensis]|uniref:hypothetical protein n=1 Tax=Variibacter gotjawalensis TaxID=1333996 RepID=UPI000BBA912C|nr:hypothetical protein [Variibacter gotjawalensis]NIK48872.1 hypothetical protein [Variibacter gotjawalensis]